MGKKQKLMIPTPNHKLVAIPNYNLFHVGIDKAEKEYQMLASLASNILIIVFMLFFFFLSLSNANIRFQFSLLKLPPSSLDIY